MLLERLMVRACGKLPLEAEFKLAPGMNLMLAPNEAGKTTLSRLISGLFYGFGKRVGGAHPLAPWFGGPRGVEVGGAASYRLADGRGFLLRRHLMGRGEKLELSSEDGQAVELDGQSPGRLHMGLERGVFLTVSHIALDDLQAAFSGDAPKERKQTGQGLLGYFFAEAATRGQLANPVKVREAWQRRADARFSPDGRKGREDRELSEKISAAQEELSQAHSRERQAKELADGLSNLRAQADQLDKTRQKNRVELEQAGKDLARATHLTRKRELAAHAAEVVGAGLADEASVGRAEKLISQGDESRSAAKRAKELSTAAQARAKELVGSEYPGQLEQNAAALSQRLAVLESQEAGNQGRSQDMSLAVAALESRWAMSAHNLAALDEELPFALDDLQGQKAKADEILKTAQQAMDAHPPLPAFKKSALALGLGLVVAGMGIKAALWAGVAGWPWWTGVLSWSLVAAGFGGCYWGARSRRLRLEHQDQAAGLQAALQDASGQAKELAGLVAKLAGPLSPAAIAAQPARLAAARQEALTISARQDELATAGKELTNNRAALEREIVTLGAKPGADPARVLSDLRQRARQAQEAQAEAARQKKTAIAQDQQATKLQAELETLLTDGGWGDIKGLKQARQRSRKLERIQAQLAEVDQRLGAARSGDEDLHPSSAQTNRDRARAALAQAQEELSALQAAQGEARRELSHLTGPPGPAQAQSQLSSLHARRESLARDHAVLTLAGELLGRAMEDYRLRAQPSLLKQAGKYLAQATGGAYHWLGSDLFAVNSSQEPALSARRQMESPQREARALSRGTSDQLYLCLRLALAQEITGHGEPLPLILDDPLVNFDDQRLEQTLAMLTKLATSRQVLLLTCHQQQLDMLTSLGQVNQLCLEE